MNTIKTVVVTATLLAVGYGANAVLNNPISDRGGSTWDDPAIGGFADGAPNGPPKIDLPTLPPSDTGPGNPFAQPEATAALEPPSPYTGLDGGNGPKAYGSAPRGPESAPGSNLVPVPPQSQAGSAPASEAITPLVPPSGQLVTPSAPFGASSEPLDRPAGPLDVPAGPQPATGAMASFLQPAGASSIEEIWRSTQEKIQAGELSDALFTLSMLYHNEQLTSEDHDRLIPMLDQLAGTVIYSREHLLLPPHTAEGGESLAQIAQQFDLPADFLARVNGLGVSQPLSPGQQVKVVRGPFRGELSLARRELTLFLGRNYAGRFSVALGRDFPEQIVTLEVVEKSGPRPYNDLRTGQQVAAGDPRNPYGNHWIGLRNPAQPGGVSLAMHASGAAVEAADSRGCISVSEADANDLKAILSVGSRISVLP